MYYRRFLELHGSAIHGVLKAKGVPAGQPAAKQMAQFYQEFKQTHPALIYGTAPSKKFLRRGNFVFAFLQAESRRKNTSLAKSRKEFLRLPQEMQAKFASVPTSAIFERFPKRFKLVVGFGKYYSAWKKANPTAPTPNMSALWDAFLKDKRKKEGPEAKARRKAQTIAARRWRQRQRTPSTTPQE